MNNFMAKATPALHWLGAQFAAMAHTATNIASDGSEPARQTVIYLMVIIALAYLLTKIAKKAGK